MVNLNIKFYDVLVEVIAKGQALVGLEPDEVEEWIKAAKVIVHEGAIERVVTDKIDIVGRGFDKLFPLYDCVFIESIFAPNDPVHETRAGTLVASAKWDKDDPKFKKPKRELPKLGISPDDLGWVLNLEAFIEVDTMPAYLATAVVFVDKQGGLIPFEAPGYPFKQPYGFARHDATFTMLKLLTHKQVTSDSYNGLCHTLFEAALYTVDFIHRHKNVELEQVEMGESRQVRRARERQGKPALKPYHVLKITSGLGKGETIGARGSTHNKHAPARVHSVRGHTREYPDGLFGNPSLAGEYYIPSFMRGNRGKGEVDKHYQVIEGGESVE